MIRRPGARRALLVAVIVLGLLYVAGWVATGLRMPANAAIGGVDVGGMSPTGAAKTLRTTLAPRSDEDVVLTHGKQRFTLDPDELGLKLDVKRSVKAAGGTHSLDPRDMAALLAGRAEHRPRCPVGRDAVKDAVARIARDVDVEVVEAQITFPDGKAHPRKPVAGLAVLGGATARSDRGRLPRDHQADTGPDVPDRAGRRPGRT